MLVIRRAADPTYYLGPAVDAAVLPAIAGAGAGTWRGAGAEGLGLAGTVDATALISVMAGRMPGTRRSLAARPATVGGYDLTFSAPKSVSLLVALGSDDLARAVIDVHDSAVESTMGYVERRAVTVRRRGGGDRAVIGTDGSIAASFTHGLSRALDPHLHTHVVVANLAHGEDGRWSALDGRGLFAHRWAAAALYEAHLRQGLTGAIGVDWERRTPGHYELAGVDPVAQGLLSTRATAIRAHLAERSAAGTSSRARHVAWAVTRDPKAVHVDVPGLRQKWSRIAASAGLGAPELEAVLDRTSDRSTHVDERRFAAALMTSAHATTNRRGVVGAWASSLSHGAPVADVERSADWVLASPPTAAGASSMEESTRSVRARGVAEPSRALAGVVPPGHLVGALGPRPVAASHQRTWREAADVIDRYRTTWHVDDRAEALGSANALHLMSTRQLADRVRTGRQVEEARTRLGLHRATDLERANPRERASQLPWASRPEPATHSLGRD